jgi:DNA-binding transcriptional ArsR family regulator
MIKEICAFMGKTNETKKKIVKLLKKRDMTVTELGRELGLSTATIDQHMEELSGMGIVTKLENDHFKKLKYYRLADMKNNNTGNPDMKIAKYIIGVIVILGIAGIVSYYYIGVKSSVLNNNINNIPTAKNNSSINNSSAGRTQNPGNLSTTAIINSSVNTSAQENSTPSILPGSFEACPLIDYNLNGTIVGYSNFTRYRFNNTGIGNVSDYVMKRSISGNSTMGIFEIEEFVKNVLVQNNGGGSGFFYNKTHYATVTGVNSSVPENGLNITFYPEKYNVVENSTIIFQVRINSEGSYNGTYIVRIDGPCQGGVGPFLVTIGNGPYEGRISQKVSIYE